MRQGTAVNQLQLTAQGHAMGDARHAQVFAGKHLRDVVGGCLTLDGRVGRQDDLAEAALLYPCEQLGPLIAADWSLATALSLLVWFVFAPQCISTIAAVRRETNSWRWPLVMTAYLFALAYGASFVTYRVALALGGG